MVNIKQKETYLYDIEIFPNLLTITFVAKNSDKKEVFVFRDIIKGEDLKRLLLFLSNVNYIIGYNNFNFDDPLLNEIISGYGDKNIKLIYNLAQLIIRSQNGKEDRVSLSRTKLYKLVKSIDIMKVFAHDKLMISLKQCAVNINWHLIQDLPIDYNKQIITDEELELILSYNLNDVLITKELFVKHQEKFDLRLEIGKLYSINVLNASDSAIACLILDKYYLENSDLEKSELKELRTKRDKINIGECVNSKVKLNLIGKEFFNKLNKTFDNFTEILKFKQYDGNLIEFKLGIGGIHSVDKKLIVHSKEDWTIIDIDVASFYPSIMLNDEVYPEHLDKDVFLNILRTITNERLTAKKEGNKIKADSLKIVINSIYGKLGYKNYWLFDEKALIKVTINGQLYLLMLAEILIRERILILSANTDGITVYIKRDRIDRIKEIVREEWEKILNFDLEWVEYSSIYRRDVNNYIVVKTDGKLKCKGEFDLSQNISKGSKFKIVPEGVIDYFTKGVQPKQTVANCTDIFKFCASQKSNSKFTTLLVRINNEDDEERITLQKTNRYFVSYLDRKDINCGCLLKTGGEKDNSILKNQYITLVNKEEKDLLKKVNKEFYIEAIWDMIYTIQERQFSLF